MTQAIVLLYKDCPILYNDALPDSTVLLNIEHISTGSISTISKGGLIQNTSFRAASVLNYLKEQLAYVYYTDDPATLVFNSERTYLTTASGDYYSITVTSNDTVFKASMKEVLGFDTLSVNDDDMRSRYCDWGTWRIFVEGGSTATIPTDGLMPQNSDLSIMDKGEVTTIATSITSLKTRSHVANSGLNKADILHAFSVSIRFLTLSAAVAIEEWCCMVAGENGDSYIVEFAGLPDFAYSNFRDGTSARFKLDLAEDVTELPSSDYFELSTFKCKLGLIEYREG